MNLTGIYPLGAIDVTDSAVTAKGVAEFRNVSPNIDLIYLTGQKAFRWQSRSPLCFSSEGTLLLAMSQDSSELRDVNTGERVYQLGRADTASFSVDGRMAALVGVDAVQVIDLTKRNKLLYNIPMRTQSPAAALFSQDGKFLYVSEYQQSFKYDLSDGKQVRSYSTGLIPGMHGMLPQFAFESGSVKVIHPEKGEISIPFANLPNSPTSHEHKGWLPSQKCIDGRRNRRTSRSPGTATVLVVPRLQGWMFYRGFGACECGPPPDCVDDRRSQEDCFGPSHRDNSA